MVISNIIANNKNATTLDAHVIQTITVDNQEYNFADESPEVISTVPTDIALEDAVPEPLISLNVKGNSEQKQYEGYNFFDESAITGAISKEGVLSSKIYYNDGILYSGDAAFNNAFYLTGSVMHLKPGVYTVSADLKYSNNPSSLLNVVARFFNLDTNTWMGSGYFKSLTGIPENTWTRIIWQTYMYFTVETEGNFALCLQSGGSSAGYDNMDCQFKNITVAYGYDGKTTYEPYVGGMPSPNPEYPQPVNSTSDSEVDISIHSRNLLDLTKFEDRAGITSTLIPNGISMAYSGTSDYISIAATIGDEPDFYDTFLTLSGNYTISGNYGEAILTGFEIFYYASGNPGITILGNISKYGSGKFSMVSTRRVPKYVPGAQLVINLYFRNRTGAITDAIIEWTDIMLERGSTATEYQPYFRDTVEIPVSSGISLRAIEGISDELIVENGTVKNIQRITPFSNPDWNEFYLNGTALNSYNRNVYQLALYNAEIDASRFESSLSTEDNSLGLCSHYKNVSLSTVFNNLYYANYYGTEPPQNTISIIENHLLIYKDNESLEDFVQWWNANKENVKIYYILKTPIETDITNTDVGQQLLQLSTERGLNTMHIIAEIDPSEIKTKYWKQIR